VHLAGEPVQPVGEPVHLEGELRDPVGPAVHLVGADTYPSGELGDPLARQLVIQEFSDINSG